MPTDSSPAAAGAGPSRRTFLTGAALTGVALGAGSLIGESAAAAAAEAAVPTAPAAVGPAATCGFELDGHAAGGLQSVSGGLFVAAVGDLVKKGKRTKFISTITLEDITMTAGTGMSSAFYSALADAIKGVIKTHRCRITTRDGNGTLIAVRRYFETVVSEVAFPALDASSKEAATMTVKLAPERIDPNPATGPKQQTPSTTNWQQGLFRLTIDHVDCTSVNRIASLVISQPIASDQVGITRTPTQQIKPVDYSNLVITMPAASASSLQEWLNATLNDAKRTPRSGQLDFLSTNEKVLFSLKLSGLGIFKIAESVVSASDDNERFVTASIFCNGMTFSHSAAAVG